VYSWKTHPSCLAVLHTDMYVFCCSYAHNVAASNRWVAFVSTTVESSNPEAELAPGLALLGHIDAKFVSVVDVHEPLTDGSRCVLTVIKACVAACGAMVHGPLVIYTLHVPLPTPHSAAPSDAAYISKGYDPSTHFETTVEDVLDMYRRITGEVLDLDAPPKGAAQPEE
jgi:Rab GDP dissociation inhibitor